MTVLHNGEAYSVDASHPNHRELLQAFKEDRLDDFVLLTKTSHGVKVYAETDTSGSKTGLVVQEDGIYFGGVKLHNSLVDRITEMKRDGFAIDYMLRFLENLMENPSSRAVNELYDFLSNKGLPITDDGCFLAYKTVRKDYRAKYRGNNLTLLQGKVVDDAIYNGIGEVIECPRNEVDDERGNECSKGLHVGGLNYSGPNGWYYSSGDKVVIVKVNPKDVVSVPKDHEAQKVRVCKYEVVEDYVEKLPDGAVGEKVECDNTSYLESFEHKETEYVNPQALVQGDIIRFNYLENRRHAIVEGTNTESVNTILLHEDPNFVSTEVSYRNFSKDVMRNVQYA